MRNSLRAAMSFAAVGLLIAAGGDPAQGSLDKCQKAISKEAGKLEAKMVKTLDKCGDLYQKAQAKGDPLSSVTGKCNDALGKVFDIGNSSSAISKSKAKLNDLEGKGKCDDSDLSNLGHLPEGVFGDKWQRLVLISSWRTAYENALGANANLVNIFQEMVEAGGCPLCALVNNTPCHNHNCILDTGSGGPVNTRTSTPLATVNLSGAVPISSCNVPSVFPAGEFAVVAGPSKGILPVSVISGVAWACITAFRTEGYVNCVGAAGNPRIDTDICVDHIVDDLGGGLFADECSTGAPTEVCQPRSPDAEHSLPAGSINGGSCLNITQNTATAGDAFFLATTRIQVVLATELGPDGQPCTYDDAPASIQATATIPQTTGSASARVVDPDAMDASPDITVATITGVPAPDCSVLESSNTSGLQTVSAAAALHGLDVGGTKFDTAFSTRLNCQ